MPLALDPNATWRFVLPTDRGVAENTPAFIFRHLTGRQWTALDARLRGLSEMDRGADGFAAQLDEVKKYLAGWENMGRPYDPADLDEVISGPGEAWTVLFGILGGSGVSQADRKNSVPPSSGPSATSAPVAPTTPAAVFSKDAVPSATACTETPTPLQEKPPE